MLPKISEDRNVPAAWSARGAACVIASGSIGRSVAAAAILIHGFLISPVLAQRQMETLGRGVVAISDDSGKIFVGWRLLATDPDDVAFNVYRKTGAEAPRKLNAEPLRNATNFVDRGANSKEVLAYFVRPVQSGRELKASAPFRLPANTPSRPFISIPLQTLPGHTPNDASVGDLDGDGEYEIVLKQEMSGRDNSQAGTTGESKLEAYTLGGRFLWRINLGKTTSPTSIPTARAWRSSTSMSAHATRTAPSSATRRPAHSAGANLRRTSAGASRSTSTHAIAALRCGPRDRG